MGAGPPALLLGRERDQRPPGNHHETLLPRGRPQGRRAGGQSAYGRVPAGRRPRGRGHRTARSVSVDHSVPAWWEEEAGKRGVCVSQVAGVGGRREAGKRGVCVSQVAGVVGRREAGKRGVCVSQVAGVVGRREAGKLPLYCIGGGEASSPPLISVPTLWVGGAACLPSTYTVEAELAS